MHRGGRTVISGSSFFPNVENVRLRHLSLTKIVDLTQRNSENGFIVKLLAFVYLVLVAQSSAGAARNQGLPLVRFQSCYAGETSTTTDA